MNMQIPFPFPQQNQQAGKSQLQMELDTLAQFINNPDKVKMDEALGCLKDLCNKTYKGGKLKYNNDTYCAYSGEKITPESNLIVIEGHTFIQQQVANYYIRGGFLDISIGDLEFQKFGTQIEKIVIPLSENLLQLLYGANLNKYLEEANTHYNKRFEQPDSFVCAKTKEQCLNSLKIRIDNEEISIFWAIDNFDKIAAGLTEPQKKFIESQKRLFTQYNPSEMQRSQAF